MVNVEDTLDLRNTALEHLWMHNKDWVQMGEEGEPLILVEGHGIRVTDSDGKTYIDPNGGYQSVNIGFGRTEIAEAARQQMMELVYFPQGTTTKPLALLAEKLAQIAPGDLERSWPVTGGSEANETAIKIARAYHKRLGESGRYKIISRRGSYHGATGGVMWLGGSTWTDRSDYEPAPNGYLFGPQPNPYRCELGGETSSECAIRCAQAIEDLIVLHGPSTIAAFIAEPISSASGSAVPGDEYWPLLRQICDKYGVLIIADEVICGFGRTGKMFAMDHWNVVPDIMTIAKGLVSCYLPIAAAVATKRVCDVFAGEDNIFRQSLTFGGHPVAAAAALKNIEILEDEGMVQNAEETGAYLLEQLQDLKTDHPIIGDARGLGLLVTLDIVSDRDTKAAFSPDQGLSHRVSEKFRNQGILLGLTGDSLINITPPLCITRSEVDEIVTGVDRVMGELESELAIGK